MYFHILVKLVVQTGLPGSLYNISEGSPIKILHDHPQLFVHQIAIVELDNVLVRVVSHQHHLREAGREGGREGGRQGEREGEMKEWQERGGRKGEGKTEQREIKTDTYMYMLLYCICN